MNEKDLILDIKDLKTYFETNEGLVKAVDGISYNVRNKEILGVVGESGSGKSVTALSIMQLVPQPVGTIVGGKIKYYQNGNEIDITSLKPRSKEMRKLRGNEIAMIFQDPMTALNPVYTIGNQIIEVIKLHQKVNKKEAKELAINMLDRVGISSPKQRFDEYPHQFSGGMLQRAMIAMALSCNPKFLIADEPTTALDVTIEAQILQLMKELQEEMGMAIQLITHDLGVIGEVADRVVVMYTGTLVEKASTDEIFYNAKHPYTKGLLKSLPKIGEKKRLNPIEGSPPEMNNLPEGCYFAPRCPERHDKCIKEPEVFQISEGHTVKCWLYE